MAAVKCPHCQSDNIEPRGELWHCNTCGRDSELAAASVDEFLPKPPAKKSRKKGG